jgi:hypothetical protein
VVSAEVFNDWSRKPDAPPLASRDSNARSTDPVNRPQNAAFSKSPESSKLQVESEKQVSFVGQWTRVWRSH